MRDDLARWRPRRRMYCSLAAAWVLAGGVVLAGSGTALAVETKPVAVTVDCGPGVLVMEEAACKATVADISSEPLTPEGNVKFASDSPGSFLPGEECTLAATGAEGTAACEVAYKPEAVDSGEHEITASYEPETPHEPESNSTVLEVRLRVPTVEVGCGPGVAVFAQTTCTFTVADAGEGASPPQGVLKPAEPLHGEFDSESCELQPSLGSVEASCTINYVPTDLTAPEIEASYEPSDSLHAEASGQGPLSVTKRLTTVSLSCGTAVFVGQAATCTATVADSSPGTPFRPTETVRFQSDTAGSFSLGGVCTLTEVDPTESSCQTTYAPSQAGSGTHTITAEYVGDALHEQSQGSTALPVGAVTQPLPPAPSPSPSPAPVASVPKCHLVVTSRWRSVRNPRHKRRKITVPVLLVTYTCDQSANVRIKGVVRIPASVHKHVRTKARKVVLAAVSAKAAPGVAEPAVVLRLPSAVVKALKSGTRTHAAVTFTVRNANGAGAATLKVVVAPRRKHGR